LSELIFIEQSPRTGKRHRPDPGTTIGREGCDITVPDPEMSRRHAVIRRLDGQVAIEDVGSTNGTYVNGQRIAGVAPLREGDVVRLGNTTLRLQQPPATGEPPLPGGAAGVDTVDAGAPTLQPPPPSSSHAAGSPPPRSPRAEPPPPPPPDPARAVALPAEGPRGDVPPPQPAPHAPYTAMPAPASASLFSPPPAAAARRGSAATSLEATVFAFIVVLFTFVGVFAYYVTKPFE
jgi:predicted component of type VI protein secretion system